MPKGNPNPSPATRFSADNPGRAKQKGARDRLSAAFLADFAETWEELGKQALTACAIFDTPTFCKLGVALMPKQVELTEDQVSAIKDEDLDFLYLLLDPATSPEEKAAAMKARSMAPLPPPIMAPSSQRVN